MARTEPLRQIVSDIDVPACTADPLLDAKALDPGQKVQTVRAVEPKPAFGPMALHHKRHGRGKPLLLLHGIGGSWQSWQPILDDLARERSVIALDLPGSGESRGLAVPLSIPHLADQVTAFLHGHGLTGTDVVGLSTGGRLALELCRRGVVGTTVALGPDGFWSTGQRLWFYWSVKLADRLLRAMRHRLPDLLARRIVRSVLLLHVSPRPWRLEQSMIGDELCRRAVGPSFAHSLRSITFGPPPLGAGAGPTGKIVLGWGRRDRVCLPGQARHVLRLFPTAQLHWFDEAGHVPLWDCPAEAVRLILEATA